MTEYIKYTHGYVIQVFDNSGKLLRQEFVAGDNCTGERITDAIGSSSVCATQFYHPFDMVQPQ